MLTRITKISAAPADNSGLFGIVVVFSDSLFLVFGLGPFLQVSVRRREFVLVITKRSELISDA